MRSSLNPSTCLTDPDGLTALRSLGARSVPVLSRGDDWVFAQNIGHVVKFLGLNEATGPILSPSELMERLDLFIRTAIEVVPQMPDTSLSTEVPNRPRSYLALGHHLFRIPEVLLGGRRRCDADQQNADGRATGRHAHGRRARDLRATGAGGAACLVGFETG